MKLIRKLITLILVFIVIIVGAYAYFGGFTKIDFKVEEAGGEMVVYREMQGSYGKSADLMKSMGEELVSDFEVNVSKGIGIYYDNPNEVESDNFKWEIGSIIITDDKNKIEELKKTFLVKTLPNQEYISFDLPLKGYFSIMVGSFKVYPKIKEYLEIRGYSSEVPIMEIYDNQNKRITYRAQLVKK
ncbi:MAG: GyrI-like domain-containing protein [Bacteroidales bacterium]